MTDWSGLLIVAIIAYALLHSPGMPQPVNTLGLKQFPCEPYCVER